MIRRAPACAQEHAGVTWVNNHKTIVKHYLATWFTLDFSSVAVSFFDIWALTRVRGRGACPSDATFSSFSSQAPRSRASCCVPLWRPRVVWLPRGLWMRVVGWDVDWRLAFDPISRPLESSTHTIAPLPSFPCRSKLTGTVPAASPRSRRCASCARCVSSSSCASCERRASTSIGRHRLTSTTRCSPRSAWRWAS